MKRSLLIFAALATWTACAQSARLGSLGRNDMVVTNINIDGAIGAFAVTGAVKRAEIYGTPTRWTDATGCVWEASDIMGPWSVAAYPETEGLSIFNIRWEQSADSQAWGWMFDALTPSGHGIVDIFAGGNEESTNLEYVGDLGDPDAGIGWTLYFARHIVPNGATNIIGRVAMTNDIPDTASIENEIADIRTESSLIYRLYSGSNVVAEVTNYNSQVHAPSLRLLQINESNEYVTVWTETNGLSRTLNSAKEYTDDATNALRDVYAPRGWSATTSGMGAEAPSNTTWISTPRTVIAGGLEYAKIVDASGEVWVLTSNGMAAEFNPNTNSYFRITADDGTEVFSIEKTDAQVVGANADGITVSESSVTIPVGVVSAEHPTMYWRTALDSGDWADETNPPTGATVTWTGSAGAWVCTTAWSGERPSSLFFKFTFVQEGSVVIKNNAQTDLSTGIIVNGTRFVPSVSGNNLIWTKQ